MIERKCLNCGTWNGAQHFCTNCRAAIAPEEIQKAEQAALAKELLLQKPDKLDILFEKAKHSAKGKDIRIQGGANTIHQYLNAGLIDECCTHISPVILGSGIRLFDNLNKDVFNIEISEVTPSALTTHL